MKAFKLSARLIKTDIQTLSLLLIFVLFKTLLFKELVEAVKQAGIPVNLYLGNEITVDGDLFSYLDNNQVLTLNNSRYILLELPFHSKFAGIHDLIFKLRSLGYVPILAHPERYDYYSDVKEFEDMINEGALLQGNIGSLYRKYGSFAHDRLEELIKRHMIHFIGSDVHHAGQTSYTRINDVAHRIKILSGSESMALDLVQNNLRSVINNETIDPYTIRRPSSKLKFHLFRKES